MPSDGTFPLHELCREGQASEVRALVDEQPDLVLKKDLDSRYPLHWAISYQHVDIIEFLLSRMQNVDLDDLVDDSGWSPVHIACSVGNIDVVTKLLNHSTKPDVNLTTTQGISALHLACSKQHLSIARLLTQEGASVRLKDARNQVPLHRAASIGSLPLVDLLCQNKSPVNIKDVQGWTPLFHALSEGHGDVAVALVQKYNADFVDLRDVDGKSPLDVAADEKVKDYFLHNTK
ncbi:LADA_0H19394g1_1 [Lachancea dasiensis]|uniref:LADA_0H19394g1_1 n=1 Tax=Lachancea dasiensis TaxID=1072105 RepID=A0A1G4K6B9_9SACH|nr:LADA_0H19394g1_1 [Lachancea dasiensis]